MIKRVFIKQTDAEWPASPSQKHQSTHSFARELKKSKRYAYLSALHFMRSVFVLPRSALWGGGLALKIITVGNIRKVFGHARRGNYSVIATAIRNLWEQNRIASLDSFENVEYEEFRCEPLHSGQPLVSGIIPCFIYGRYVEDAVDSVLRQTLKHVEVIVVDGGSTDQFTIEVLRKLERPRTRVFFQNGRHLVGDNRNFGINQATGRYICCLDADDMLEPTYLEKAVFLLEMYGYDVTSTAIRFFGTKSGTLGILPTPELRAMVQGNHVLTCAVFRRLLWEKSGGYFDVGLGQEHIAEDWDFWIRLAALGARIRNISGEALFNYRIHQNGSLSSSAGVKSVADQGKVIIKRNHDLLTPAAYSLSTKQKERLLRANSQSTALTQSMLNLDLAGSDLTLMLVIPYMLVGGAERLLSQITGYLVRHSWRVIIITTDNQDASHGDAIDWFQKHTSEVYALPRFLQPSEWQDFIEHLIISRRPDCFLTAGSQFFYELLPILTERYPMIAIVDLLFNTFGHVESHLRYKDFYTFALAESDDVLQWYLESGWEKNRVRKLTSGVDLALYRPRPKPMELVDYFGITPAEFVVGFSGRLSPEKAPEVFIEIARLCKGVPNLRFMMTGGGPMTDEISNLVANLPFNVRFDFVGIVDDVTPYLALYDILVLPSRLDGRPLVVLEALACGIPVIASRIGALPEVIVNDYNGYLCAPAVATEFAANISILASDRLRVEKLKVGARTFAEQNLDAEVSFAYYENSFREAINFRRNYNG